MTIKAGKIMMVEVRLSSLQSSEKLMIIYYESKTVLSKAPV